MNVMHALHALLGGGPDVRRMDVRGSGGPISHAAPSRAAVQQANAQIEADGAAMYNQAHPGQAYRTNQNGEFAPGELPAGYQAGSMIWAGHRTAPLSPLHQLIRGGSPQGFPGPMGGDYDGPIANHQQLGQTLSQRDLQPTIRPVQMQGTRQPYAMSLQNGDGVSDISLQGTQQRRPGNINF